MRDTYSISIEIKDIDDSMKGSSSRMKNKVGAQKGAFIKMKQENSYIYQRVCVLCYVPIIAPFQTLLKSTEINANPVYCGFQRTSYFPGNLPHVLRIAILGW